jgi:hypothetical protein
MQHSLRRLASFLLLLVAVSRLDGQEFERWFIQVAEHDPAVEQQLDAAVRLFGGTVFSRDDSGAAMYLLRRPGTLDVLERLDRSGVLQLLLVGDDVCPFLAETCEEVVGILVYFDPAEGSFATRADTMTAAVEQLGGVEASRDEPHVRYRLPPETLDQLPDVGGVSWSYEGTLVGFPDVPPKVLPMSSLRIGDRGRFLVSVAFRVPEQVEPTVAAARLLTVDGAAFAFFDEENPEVLVKILDGCGSTGSYWLFASGLTDLATETTVLDLVTGRSWIYRSRGGEAYPSTVDTASLDVCDN